MECSVLVVGDSERPEFRPVSASFARRPSRCAWDLSAAMGMLADRGQEPDLLVLLQSWPGQFDAGQFQELRRLAPLAAVINVLGSWCEGEARSGVPLPGTIRVHWHEWPARFALDDLQASGGECPLWGLPVTSTEEDRLLWAVEHPHLLTFDNGLRERAIGVLTHRRPMWALLADACRQFGRHAVWLRSDLEPIPADLSAVLWDRHGDPADESQLARISAAQTERPPVLALDTFPRAEDAERLRRLGVTALIGKPLRVDELRWHLARIGLPPALQRPVT